MSELLTAALGATLKLLSAAPGATLTLLPWSINVAR